jgi:hypothetical protein
MSDLNKDLIEQLLQRIDLLEKGNQAPQADQEGL